MKASKPCCSKLSLIASAVLTCIASASTVAGSRVIQSDQNVVLFTSQGSAANQSSAANNIDYIRAQPLPLPQAFTQPLSLLDSLLEAQQNSKSPAAPKVFEGGQGNGKLNPVVLVPPGSSSAKALDEIVPQESGTANHVYTTSRTNAKNNATTRYYPYSPAGKLWFKVNSATYMCSASLIKPGVLVTAAHCVANFGKKKYYSGWQFAPGYDGGVAPFGVTTAKSVLVKASYFNGTDSCTQAGVVCQNDVAVIVLNKNLGNSCGWYGYGANNYSYVNKQVMISQLGYPVAMDNGSSQQRTDSQGYVSSAMSNNTIIGSLQSNGSSGGPWLVNLGMAPTLNGTSFGPASQHNLVVGVTSWGYVDDTEKEQGASPFTGSNIVSLVNSACSANPEAC